MFIRLNEYYYNGGESSKPVLINVEGISSVQEYAGGYSADRLWIGDIMDVKQNYSQ